MALSIGRHDKTDTLSTVSSIAKVYPGAVGAADYLWAVVVWQGTVRTCTVADDVNGGWTAQTSQILVSGLGTLQIFTKPNSASGTPTVTATFSGTVTYCAMNYGSVTGSPQTSGTLDSGNSVTFGHGTGTGTTETGTSETPSVNNCLVVGIGINAGQGFQNAAGVFTQGDSSANLALGTEWVTQTTATSVAASFTSSNQVWDVYQLIIQPSVPLALDDDYDVPRPPLDDLLVTVFG